LKKLTSPPSTQELKTLINEALVKTNRDLLEGDINTELSGSTVVVIILYNDRVISFNVGDSRAIMIRQLTSEKTEKEGE
jgi:serine/threonine protein phosphatase PrpC